MKKIAFLFLVVLTSASCSRTSLLVQWADTFIYWRLDDSFDLSGEQSKPVRQAVNNSVQNLKTQWLPQVGKNFQQTEMILQKSFPDSVESANQFVSSLETDISALTTAAWKIISPEMKSALQSLKWSNWLHYQKEFEKQNEKILDGKNKCVDRFEDQLDDWIGSISKKQESRIEGFCKENVWPKEVRVKNRNHTLAWFEKTAEISEETFSPDKIHSTLEQWLQNADASALPEYVQVKKKSQEALRETLVWLVLNLSEKQQKHFIQRLGERAKEIEKI